MYAVVFEVLPTTGGTARYLELAAALRPRLDRIDGFLSIERFRSVTAPGWILSLSMWRDEAALVQWRGDGPHHAAQGEGRAAVFADYRLRVLRMAGQEGVSGPRLGLHMHDGHAAGSFRSRYVALADAARHIDLLDGTDTAIPYARWGEVLRDYGMRDRAQAPQVFPPPGHARAGA